MTNGFHSLEHNAHWRIFIYPDGTLPPIPASTVQRFLYSQLSISFTRVIAFASVRCTSMSDIIIQMWSLFLYNKRIIIHSIARVNSGGESHIVELEPGCWYHWFASRLMKLASAIRVEFTNYEKEKRRFLLSSTSFSLACLWLYKP
jgi:hypothetical protein